MLCQSYDRRLLDFLLSRKSRDKVLPCHHKGEQYVRIGLGWGPALKARQKTDKQEELDVSLCCCVIEAEHKAEKMD